MANRKRTKQTMISGCRVWIGWTRSRETRSYFHNPRPLGGWSDLFNCAKGKKVYYFSILSAIALSV